MNMSAVVHYALEPGAVELREIAVPEIADDQVLLQVGAVSVCGSDVHQARNTHSWPVSSYPPAPSLVAGLGAESPCVERSSVQA